MTSATVIVGLLALLVWVVWRRGDPRCPFCFEGTLVRIARGKRRCDVCGRHFRRTTPPQRRSRFGAVSKLGIAALIALLALSASAKAPLLIAHGGDSSQMHACLAPTGYLRVVPPSEVCEDDETVLHLYMAGASFPQFS
ncbi:MAG TPA: hypothetical protein VJO34_16840 [Methylomirabilota bacterium]|nr:hypothetical protein [Methylomirabilota bacterium]